MADPEGVPVATPGLVAEAAVAVRPLILAIDGAVDAQRELEQQLRIEFGLNNTDFRALLIVFRLRRRHQHVRATDLQRGLGVSSGAASQIVDRLSRAGLVRRSGDPADARASALMLTDDASERLAASTEAVRNDLDALVSTLSPDEEERIVDLLDQVRDVFREHHRTKRAERHP